MKRHLSFISLSREHHDGLLLAVRLQQGKNALLRMWSHDLHWQAEFVVKYFDDNLDNHFQIEEKVVFPEIYQPLREQAVLVQRLQDEHAELRNMVEFLRHPSQKTLENTLMQFGKILEQHIRSEERELFPMLEAHLSEDHLNHIARKIKQFPGATA